MVRKRGVSRTSSATKVAARYRAKYQLNPITKRYKKLLPVMYPQVWHWLYIADILEVMLFAEYDLLGIPEALWSLYTAWAKRKGVSGLAFAETTQEAEASILFDEFVLRGLDPDWLIELEATVDDWIKLIRGIPLGPPPFWFSGFETGDYSEWYWVFGSPTIDSTVKYAGAYSSKSENDLRYSYGVKTDIQPSKPNDYQLEGYMRIDSLVLPLTPLYPYVPPPQNEGRMILILGPTDRNDWGPWGRFGDYGDSCPYFAVKNVSGAYKLGLWDDANTIFYDSGLTLSYGVWYKILMKIFNSDYGYPSGSVELYINDELKATASGTWTGALRIWAGAGGTQPSLGQGSVIMWVDSIGLYNIP